MATAFHLHGGDDDLGKAPATANGQPRRKGIGTRVWLVISESGNSHSEEFGKQSIMRRTGLPARDLRILDPKLSYPSTVLGRERAIVINLEHIKAIVTATEVLMVYSTNPLVVQFVQDLRDRLSSPTNTPIQQDGELLSRRTVTDEDAAERKWGHNDLNMQDTGDENNRQSTESSKFPFEFRALEACLESACRCLESETQTLEQEAYPALDELTSKISTLNLERVRQIKSRLVAISGRVQKVRDELEHLLDDDNDMAEMYLTEKLASSSVDRTSVRDDLGDEALEDEERTEESNSQHSSSMYTGMKFNVEELEMLLEAYFAQIDGISQKLFHMNEYVDDTEDFINIMLDDKQNQLLQMGVMLSTGNLILNAGIVVVGLFGMNITIELFSGQPVQFWETALGTTGGCIALYLIAVGWGKRKNLI